MLYAENKNKVRVINGEEPDFELNADQEGLPNKTDPELLFNMREEMGIRDISTFLQNTN